MSRSQKLKAYLEQDPDNLSLIADAAGAALDEGDAEEATRLVDHYATLAPLPPSLINLLGMIAIAEQRDEDAATLFGRLLEANPEDGALRYNMALVLERQGEREAALNLVESGEETSQATALRVKLLHHLGRLEEALSIGEAWEGKEGGPDLWGVLSAVAIDLEDVGRARGWAERGRDTPEGQATLGTLALADNDLDRARSHFNAVVELRPQTARGAMGLGMIEMREGNPTAAAGHLEQAALAFGDHLGAWVAAGWSWVLSENLAKARACFEEAARLDDTFGEAHGGLAFLALIEGNSEEADRQSRIALRLDRTGLGGALVQSQIAESAGRTALANKIRETALTTPLGPKGETIASLIEAYAQQRSAEPGAKSKPE